jgi:hypothetical protein
MRKLIPVLLLIVFTAAPWCGPALAQEKAEEPPAVARLWFFQVKPQHFLQFESALMSHMAWHKKNEAKYDWNVFQVIVGRDYGTYVIRSQNLTWEDLDANAEFFARQVEHFRLNVTPLLQSIEGRLVEMDWKNTNWPDDLAMPKMIEAYYYYLDPEKVEGFIEAQAEFHKAFMEQDWQVPYAWSWTRNGGYVPTVTLIMPRTSWTDFKEPEKNFMEVLTAAYGEGKAKELVAQFRGAIKKIDSMVVAYRPDLSYAAKE